MEILLPSQTEEILINEQRGQVADVMAHAGALESDMLAVPGPCSADMNQMPGGELSTVNHVKQLAVVGEAATNSLVVVRYVAEKPRTNTGPTGILHAPGGVQAYTQGAHQLHRAGIPFASEVMSDASAAVVVPHLSMAWVGAREVSATGPRYNVRPTSRDLDKGIHPLPTWVKNDQNGNLGHTINALHTIMGETPETRLRIGMHGLEEVTTHGNPHVGVILRGQDVRPDGPLEEVLAAEITSAREQLDAEFGANRIPLLVDVSHAHAKYEGGGEAGQLAVAHALGNIMLTIPVDGWMAETYILPGKQPANGTAPGLSITDPCIRQTYAEQLIADMDASRSMASLLIADTVSAV
jgi:phospho-2-dehydro-3-deoxyheptonate aldolase